MALKLLKNPYVLAGAGAIALFGATVYQVSSNRVHNTGFHYKDTDPTLRIVEKDVIIPKYMTDRARQEKCKPEVAAFIGCVNKTEPGTWARFMTFRTCKKDSDIMMECMNSYFIDERFYEENKKLYLQDKAIYKKCKVLKKDRIVIKEVIASKTPPTFEMRADATKYYNAVKEHFDQTGDVDSYDNSLLSSREVDATENSKAVEQIASVGL